MLLMETDSKGGILIIISTSKPNFRGFTLIGMADRKQEEEQEEEKELNMNCRMQLAARSRFELNLKH